MEHRLILGGEMYLPFARSCITKLKKLGLPYANQSFEIDGVSVKVRIEPGHEYIRLEGGSPILSGLVKDGVVVTTNGKKSLDVFLPTDDCVTRVLKKKLPASYYSEPRLVSTAIPALRPEPGGSNVATVCPSMYSGKMQSAVQYALGLTSKSTSRPFEYCYSWDNTHLISVGNLGGKYLVQISSEFGVMAKKLAVVKPIEGSAASKESMKEFGGVPDGKSFPRGEALDKLIESGAVAVLATSADLSEFYDGRFPLSYDHGWTTNTSGSEAHSVTMWQTEFGEIRAGHYKLILNLVERPDDAPPNDPCVSSDVTLLFVESGRVCWGGGTTLNGTEPLGAVAYDHKRALDVSEPWVSLLADYVPAVNGVRTTVECDTPVFVYFDADTLKVVRYKWSNKILANPTVITSGSSPKTIVTARPKSAAVMWPYLSEDEGPAFIKFGDFSSYSVETFSYSNWPGFSEPYNSNYSGSTFINGYRKQIAVFPQGMRNGWLSGIYYIGDYVYEAKSASSYVQAHSLPLIAVRTLISGSGTWPGVSEWMTSESFGSTYSLHDFSAQYIDMTWSTSEYTKKITGVDAYEYIRFSNRTDTHTEAGELMRSVWYADSTNNNSIRSDRLISVFGVGPLAATETNSHTFSFTGFTG